MSVTQINNRRLRAPREDRAVLIAPPFGQVADMVAENVRLRGQQDYDFQGRSLVQLSQLARRELLDAARRYTTAYRDTSLWEATPVADGGTVHGGSATGVASYSPTSSAAISATPLAQPEPLIFLAGHQPQMFHPGVWLKDFALGALAKQHGAIAVNLVVDSDTLSTPLLRVPGGSVSEPQTELIPFDRPEPAIPFEQRRIEDREMFATFGRRVADRIAPLVADPLVEQYWPLVLSRAEETDNLGMCLSQARHQMEGRWGLQTLEVPQSLVCAGEAFQWFMAHLLAQLPRFREVYNEAVRDYRRRHRIRSAAHPAPELAEDGPWLEAPLWVWTAANPWRRRLFAQFNSNEILLSDRHSWQSRLPLGPDGDAAAAVAKLLELQQEGVKICSRALVTTLWARLVLGDLFIHGIGGAKYDEVTNLLIERFFGVQPPGLMILSGTLHLPIERHRATADDARAIQRELREMTYHPERFLKGSQEVPRDPLLNKKTWIETPQTPQNAQQRCRAIRQANESLQPWLADRRRQLVARQAETARLLEAENILAWREYAFCLYPESTVRGFFAGLLPKNA